MKLRQKNLENYWIKKKIKVRITINEAVPNERINTMSSHILVDIEMGQAKLKISNHPRFFAKHAATLKMLNCQCITMLKKVLLTALALSCVSQTKLAPKTYDIAASTSFS
jgi:hypothetical protein